MGVPKLKFEPKSIPKSEKMTVEEEQRITCKYCTSNHGDREYGLHRLSNAHIKKVKVELMQCEFSGVCLVCKNGLKDLKDVENHVQSGTHQTKLMASHSGSSYVITNNSTCESCAILFHNSIALETHRLLPPHRREEMACHYPKLNELLKEVSGLPGEELAIQMTPLCRICNIQLDGLEAYIMHLFTTAHITRVRFSECFMCSKAFVHAENRETHLITAKHVSALQKWNKGMKEGHQVLTKGAGYPCMVCMIRCSSWLCLELHLKYTHHYQLIRQTNKDHSLLETMKFILPKDAADGDDDDDSCSICCDISHAQRWREWRGSVLKEHAWCHVCGISLPNLDAVNEHLHSHETKEFSTILPKKHAAQQVSECSEFTDLLKCCLCGLSFKSALILSAHKACIGHHRRLVDSLVPTHLTCCANCGIIVDKESKMGNDERKVTESKSQANELSHATNNIATCDGKEVSKHSAVMSCTKSCHGTLTSADLGIPLTGNGLPPLCMQDKPRVYDACHIDVERSPPNGDGGPFPLTNASKVKFEKEAELSQPLTDDVATKTSKVRCGNACPDEVEFDNPVHVLQHAHVKIPVVTAAALVPLAALQQSMQLMVNVVADALLKSLPDFVQNPAKRKQEKNDQVGTKKHCSEQKPVDYNLPHHTFAPHTNFEGDGLHTSADAEKVVVSMADDKKLWQKDTLLAVSASVIPNPLSDLSALLPMPEAMLAGGKQVIGMADGADDATILAGGKQVIGMADGADDATILADGINTSVEGGGKASHCHSKLLEADQASQSTLMGIHSHDNEISLTMKEALGFKAKERAELTVEPDTTPQSIEIEKRDVDKDDACIKSGKQDIDNDAHDDDALNFSNNFQDADLWWAMSDSEEGEIDEKQD